MDYVASFIIESPHIFLHFQPVLGLLGEKHCRCGGYPERYLATAAEKVLQRDDCIQQAINRVDPFSNRPQDSPSCDGD